MDILDHIILAFWIILNMGISDKMEQNNLLQITIKEVITQPLKA